MNENWSERQESTRPSEGDDFSSLFPTPPPPTDHEEPAGAGGSTPPPRRRRRAALAASLAALVLLASGVGIGWGLTGGGHGPSTGGTASSGGSASGSSVQSVANKVDPAVVDISTYVNLRSYPFNRGSSAPLGAGTGMILTSTGEILTNNHVIEGATRIRVTSPSLSRTWTARVLGADPTHDVALLQLDGASGLPTVQLADASALQVGRAVIAIGNALGQGGSPTVTRGSITAVGRSIDVGDGRGGSEHLSNLIQTDAPISPGDSGGPLVTTSGQVLGIITASSRGDFTGPASNVGFAIPASDANDIVQQVRAGHGSSTIIIGEAGFLGVQVRDLTPQLAALNGLGVTSGAFVAAVVSGTPATAIGIQPDSAIVAVNGQRVSSADALGPALHVHKPGQQVRVTWVDRSGTHSANVTLVAGPAV
jgi:S1-C subfamily serine protease